MSLNRKYPPKPYIPMFRDSFPGAQHARCLFVYPSYLRGKQGGADYVPNLIRKYTALRRHTVGGIVTQDPMGIMGPTLDFPVQSGTRGLIASTANWAGNFSEQTIVIHLRNDTTTIRNCGHFGTNLNFGGGAVGKSVTCQLWGSGAFRWAGNTEGNGKLSWNSALPGGHYTDHLWICTTGPRGMEAWCDGILIASNASNKTMTSSTAIVSVGGGSLGLVAYGVYKPHASISYVCTYSKQLTRAEIASLFSDPWGMIRPSKPTMIMPYANIYDAFPEWVSTETIMEIGPVEMGIEPAESDVGDPIALSILAEDDLEIVPAQGYLSPDETTRPGLTIGVQDNLDLLPVEGVFTVENPAAQIEDTLEITPAEGVLVVEDPAAQVEDTLEIDPVEALFDVTDQATGIYAQDTLEIEPVEALFAVEDPELSTGVVLVLSPVEAEIAVFAPSALSEDTLLLTPVEGVWAVAAPGAASQDVLELPSVEALFEVEEPAVAAQDTLEISPAQGLLVVEAPEIDLGVVLVLPPVEAEIAVFSPTALSEDTLVLSPIEDALTVSSPFVAAAVDLDAVEAVFEVAAPSIQADDKLTLEVATAKFEAAIQELTASDTLTPDPVEGIFEVPLPEVLAAPGIVPVEFLIELIAMSLTTEDDVYYSQKQRIHNALIEAALGGVFLPITYDPDTKLMDVGDEDTDRITPETILANDTSCAFGPAERYRRSLIFERGSWDWTLKLSFNQNALLELFEKRLIENLIKLPMDKTKELEQVIIQLKDAEYSHPTQQQPTTGTSVTYTLEARLGRK